MRQPLLALILGAAAALTSGLPSRAQSAQEVTFVACKQGDGCRCTLSGMDAALVASVLNNQDPPSNSDTLILLTDETESKWSALTPDAADAQYGGDGICPIEVFDPVLPEDGAWVGTVRATSITGCPQQVAQMVPPMVSGMVFSRQIAWGNTFDPAQLSQTPGSGVVTWTKRTPVLYSGTLNAPVKSDVLKVEGALTASLQTPETAVATLRLRIGAAGPKAAALIALGMNNCRTTAVYDFKRVGP